MSNQIPKNTYNYKNYNKKIWNDGEKKNNLNKYLEHTSNEQKYKFWIKTLLSAYSIYPEIIKTVDKIIELQATSISFTSEIYDYSKTTIKQMDAIIDLSQRKDSLVNIFLLTKQIIGAVAGESHDILEKRFCMNWSVEEIAHEYEISVRTAYRKLDRIMGEIYQYLKSNNWSIKFIESQVKDEAWLMDRYYKNVSDYIKNTYAPSNKKLFEVNMDDI